MPAPSKDNPADFNTPKDFMIAGLIQAYNDGNVPSMYDSLVKRDLSVFAVIPVTFFVQLFYGGPLSCSIILLPVLYIGHSRTMNTTKYAFTYAISACIRSFALYTASY